jgi:hypothetical protein
MSSNLGILRPYARIIQTTARTRKRASQTHGSKAARSIYSSARNKIAKMTAADARFVMRHLLLLSPLFTSPHRCARAGWSCARVVHPCLRQRPRAAPPLQPMTGDGPRAENAVA